MVKINKGDFEEDIKVEERFIGESAKKETKIAADTTFTDVTDGEVVGFPAGCGATAGARGF